MKKDMTMTTTKKKPQQAETTMSPGAPVPVVRARAEHLAAGKSLRARVPRNSLATTPTTGLQVQACGDCHLLNFGVFATPERHLIFDLNDFDETHPAPWEWDLKRLAASFVIAARDLGLSKG